MNDNPIVIESDLNDIVSSSLRRGMESELHSFSSVSGVFKSKIICLTDNSEMEGTLGECLLGKAPSMDSSKTLFPRKCDLDENVVEKPMSPLSWLTQK